MMHVLPPVIMHHYTEHPLSVPVSSELNNWRNQFDIIETLDNGGFPWIHIIVSVPSYQRLNCLEMTPFVEETE